MKEKRKKHLWRKLVAFQQIFQFLSLDIFVFLFSNSNYFSISPTSFTICTLGIKDSSHVPSHILTVLCPYILHTHET